MTEGGRCAPPPGCLRRRSRTGAPAPGRGDRRRRAALYLLPPPVVLGPHAVGAKDLLPGPLAPLGRILASRIGRSPVPLPMLVPLLPLQFVHEDDLGQALLRCVLGAGPPGAYNIAADGILSTADVAREFGLIPLPLPAGPAGWRPAPSPRCRSCRPLPSGWRRPATRRSWTRPRRSGIGLDAPLYRPGSPAGHAAPAAARPLRYPFGVARRGCGAHQAMPAPILSFTRVAPGSGCSLPLEIHPARVRGQVGLLRSVRGKAITHCPEESA